MKRPLPAAVCFATGDGTLQTLEGEVRYAAGDALVTGVAGERWPIRRQVFEASYEPCDGQPMGRDGHYRKRAMAVQAQQWPEGGVLALDAGRGTLTAHPGDWCVRDASGKTWVVADAIFRISYVALEAPGV